MNSSIALIAVGATILLVGCERAEPKVTWKIKEVRAYGCGPNCNSLLVNFEIKNESRLLMCLPYEYSGDQAADYIAVLDADGSSHVAVRSTGLLPVEARGSDNKRAQWLFGQPNYVVQPGGTVEIRTALDHMFEIPKTAHWAEIKLFTYPCAGEDFKRSGSKVDVLRAPITFIK